MVLRNCWSSVQSAFVFCVFSALHNLVVLALHWVWKHCSYKPVIKQNSELRGFCRRPCRSIKWNIKSNSTEAQGLLTCQWCGVFVFTCLLTPVQIMRVALKPLLEMWMMQCERCMSNPWMMQKVKRSYWLWCAKEHEPPFCSQGC